MSQEDYLEDHAWCFTTSDECIWQAAYAWQAIKTLRLCRARQQATYTAGKISLASLPNEVIAIIEFDLGRYELYSAFDQVPQNECLCYDGWLYHLNDDSQRRWTFEEFCERMGLPSTSADGELDDCLRAFKTSSRGADLWDDWVEIHAPIGLCKGIDAGTRFWESMGNYLDGYDEPPSDEYDKFDPKLGARLRSFLDDFHLDVLYEPIQEKEAEDLFTLCFLETIASCDPDIDPPSFPYNRNRIMRKLKIIGLVLADDEREADEAEPTIQWRTLEIGF